MYARIVTFRLDGPTADEYRAQAAASADSFNDWVGLQAKLWLADDERSRYGGFYLFDSVADADRSRSTAPFLALVDSPVFAELSIEEFEILDAPSGVTADRLMSALAIPNRSAS